MVIIMVMNRYLDFVGDVGKVEDSLVGGDDDGLLAVFLDGAVEPLVGRWRIGFGLTFQFGRRVVQRHGQLRFDCRTHAANYRSICIPHKHLIIIRVSGFIASLLGATCSHGRLISVSLPKRPWKFIQTTHKSLFCQRGSVSSAFCLLRLTHRHFHWHSILLPAMASIISNWIASYWFQFRSNIDGRSHSFEIYWIILGSVQFSCSISMNWIFIQRVKFTNGIFIHPLNGGLNTRRKRWRRRENGWI